jgi:DNA-binding transcriptional ArsR family regulator
VDRSRSRPAGWLLRPLCEVRTVPVEDTDQALHLLLHHPLRRRLWRLYVEEGEELSPKELADFTKQPLVNVALHVRVLRDHGAVELVRERPARGAVEHFYAATGLVDAVPWARPALGLPQPAK